MPSKSRPGVVSVPAGPRREIPAGMFKCGDCGKTLSESLKSPGWPPEWVCCVLCSPKRRIETPWSNPLGPSALTPGPQRGDGG